MSMTAPELALAPPQDLDQVLDASIVGAAYLHKLREVLRLMCTNKEKPSRCIEKCDTLLDITWEQLNTGHWKDVSITWRHAYTVLSWIKAWNQMLLLTSSSVSGISKDEASTEGNGLEMLQQAVKTCDMGLLMGAPIHDNILTKLVSKLQNKYTAKLKAQKAVQSKDDGNELPTKRLKIDTNKVPEINFPVSILNQPSLVYFQQNHMVPEVPLIINGAMDYWPAMDSRKWSLDYLRTIAGCRTVPIEIGSKYTEDEWSQSLLTVSEFIDQFIVNPKASAATTKKGYLAQHQLFDQIPELRNDIDVPSYCALTDNDDEDVDINAWFGPEGTVSPLHQDPKHNLLCQVVGQKYVRLYSTKTTASVYPHEAPLFSNTSQVDVENPDVVKFPDFPSAPYLECVLKQGQMLYIPPKYWHYVRSLDISFSVSFWWQ